MPQNDKPESPRTEKGRNGVRGGKNTEANKAHIEAGWQYTRVPTSFLMLILSQTQEMFQNISTQRGSQGEGGQPGSSCCRHPLGCRMGETWGRGGTEVSGLGGYNTGKGAITILTNNSYKPIIVATIY